MFLFLLVIKLILFEIEQLLINPCTGTGTTALEMCSNCVLTLCAENVQELCVRTV